MHLDLTILGTLVVLLTLFGVWKGRGTLLSLGLSLYPTALIYQYFPYLTQVTIFKQTPFYEAVSHAVVFLIFLVLINWGLRVIASSFYASKGVFPILLISISLAGLLVAFEYHLPGLDNLHDFGPTILNLVSSNFAYFIWLVLPPIVAFIFR